MFLFSLPLHSRHNFRHNSFHPRAPTIIYYLYICVLPLSFNFPKLFILCFLSISHFISSFIFLIFIILPISITTTRSLPPPVLSRSCLPLLILTSLFFLFYFTSASSSARQLPLTCATFRDSLWISFSFYHQSCRGDWHQRQRFLSTPFDEILLSHLFLPPPPSLPNRPLTSTSFPFSIHRIHFLEVRTQRFL